MSGFRSKPRKKRSPIWVVDVKLLSSVTSASASFSGILRNLKMTATGGNVLTLKKRLHHDGIDYSHIPEGRGHNKGRPRIPSRAIPLNQVLIKDSSYNRGHLKKRLIEEGWLPNSCAECGLHTMWNNKIINLVIDHINGISTDNRLENLQLLCPNCNSQTSTFSGRNKPYKSVWLGE